jgi:hypothetical protein
LKILLENLLNEIHQIACLGREAHMIDCGVGAPTFGDVVHANLRHPVSLPSMPFSLL